MFSIFQLVLGDDEEDICLKNCGDVYYESFKTANRTGISDLKSSMKTLHEKYEMCNNICQTRKAPPSYKSMEEEDIEGLSEEFLRRLENYRSNLDFMNRRFVSLSNEKSDDDSDFFMTLIIMLCACTLMFLFIGVILIVRAKNMS